MLYVMETEVRQVCRHGLKAISVMVAIRKTSGHVVYIGWCQKKAQRLAVVLDMWSEQEVDTFVRGYKETKQSVLPRLSLNLSLPPVQLPARESGRTPRPTLSASITPTLQSKDSQSLPSLPHLSDHMSQLHSVRSLPSPPLPPRKPPLNLSFTEELTSPPVPLRPCVLPKPSLESQPPSETKPPFEIKPPLESKPSRRTEMPMAAHLPTPDLSPQNAIEAVQCHREEQIYSTPKTMKAKLLPSVGKNRGDAVHANTFPSLYTGNSTNISRASVPGSSNKEKRIYNVAAPSNCSATPQPPQGDRKSSSGALPFALTPAAAAPDNDSEWHSEDEDDFNYENNETYCTFLGISVRESERIYMKSSMIQQQPEETVSSLEDDLCYFLNNEYDYISCIERIKNERKLLNPELQYLLRGAEALAEIHNDMYREMHDGYRSCSRIAYAFTSRKDQLEQYAYYLMNAPKIITHVEDLPEGMKVLLPTLNEDLRTSWKRLHFYFMSLEKMLSRAPLEDREALQEAVEMLRDLNRKGDSGILLDGVKEAPFDLLLYCPLILHNAFKIKGPLTTKGKTDYRVLLFPDIIVVTLPKKDQYEYQEHLLINQVNFIAGNSISNKEFDLEIVLGGSKRNKKYMFRAPSVEVRDAWVDEITRLLHVNAEKIKTLATKRFGYADATE
ncbi:hypothetical protein OTU49_012479 [Cherax quadricarinatus]|uniref:PH domain-containing protein n=1 Tax=Cherax quadricarinatus TaxID=27406 RepID=A0AAW0YL75_CHEQU